MDEALQQMPDDALHTHAAMQGQWGAAVSTTMQDKRKWLNPLTPPAEKAHLIAQAQREVE